MSARTTFGADDSIGGYELLRRIGRGGMAEVWVARKRSGVRGKYVALKAIHPRLARDPRFTRLFAAEARVSSLLSHSNIVQVFDVGRDQGVDFLVMEWVDGVNLVGLREALSHVDAQERFEIAAFVVGQLLHALSYAHSITTHRGRGLGIVHRDVSPQNVLVSNAGDIKLTDFGVAHTVIDESTGQSVRGKLRYMAPEQLGGDTRSPTVDLYAAGAILHELATATRFRGTTRDGRVLHGQVLEGAIPATPIPLPPKLEQLRLALLQPDPRRRLPSADAAIELLCAFEGYRDKRRAVSRLCGALTGVVRPRTGPAARMHGASVSAPRAWARSFTPLAYGSRSEARAASPAPSAVFRGVVESTESRETLSFATRTQTSSNPAKGVYPGGASRVLKAVLGAAVIVAGLGAAYSVSPDIGPLGLLGTLAAFSQPGPNYAQPSVVAPSSPPRDGAGEPVDARGARQGVCGDEGEGGQP